MSDSLSSSVERSATGFHGQVKKPGYNVDALDIERGMEELLACGYSSAETIMVIDYALRRHMRGEEEAAQRGAIDEGFHGIALTCWLRVLAAARAGAEQQRDET